MKKKHRRCANCRYWIRRNSVWGECIMARVDALGQADIDSLIYVEGNGVLLTALPFRCMMWESEE